MNPESVFEVNHCRQKHYRNLKANTPSGFTFREFLSTTKNSFLCTNEISQPSINSSKLKMHSLVRQERYTNLITAILTHTHSIVKPNSFMQRNRR